MGGYIGARAGTISATVANVQDVTATDTTPEVTIINNTHEDTDGGREGKVIFKGQQSGGEETTLAEIQGSHDGTADDEKGDLIFKTNDGSDGSSPTERLRIDSDGSISTATLGTSNVKLGLNAGKVIASGGNYNTLIGEDAGIAISTGDRNTAVGYQSLKTTSTGQYNTAIGYQALEANTGSGNTAVGDQALEANIGGANNTAVGDDAGVAVTTGSNNTFIGVAAGDGTDDGGNNTAVGKSALTSNCGDNNTAVGLEALRDTTGSVNTAIGKNSGNAITSGSKNTILGAYNGNQNNLDIRTDTNNIVLSDGDGNNRLHCTGSVWYAGNLASNKYWPVVANVSGANGCSLDSVNGTIGATTTGSPMYINKNNGDGTLLLFYSEGSFEGSVTVSGSTVSYNGGHLARWSQFTDGSRDNTLVKGTVMTNLDQMCVWEHDAVAEGDTIKNALGQDIVATENDVADAYTENNEQLNCMAVSSVEGDPNVAGVFVDWDDQDDGYNDLRIAMTGDMVIRIAKGTTVARGDLLMSAGDGTAKPQGDDIVRSKTIAKVTSTNVSHTYDDESYLVPCVLMAC